MEFKFEIPCDLEIYNHFLDMPFLTFVLDAARQSLGEHCSQINKEVSEDDRLVSLLVYGDDLGPQKDK